MSAIPASTVSASSLELLRETFEGPSGPSTQFLDNTGSGFFASLAGLTAGQASRPTRPGGATIAGHVRHVGFHLEVSDSWLHGDREPRDWSQSWTTRDVDEAAWPRLQEELRGRYESLVRTPRGGSADGPRGPLDRPGRDRARRVPPGRPEAGVRQFHRALS